MAYIERRANGYKITVSMGYDSTGRQMKKSFTWNPEPGMTERQAEKEVERQAVLFEEKCKTGQILKGDITFADFVEVWKRDFATIHLKPKTLEGYKYLLKRIIPGIGHIRLDRLQPQHLSAFYKNLAEQNIRDVTVLKPVENFRYIMKENGLTQRAIKEITGISETTLRQAYNGRNIGVETAKRLCKGLDMELGELFILPKNSKPLSAKTIRAHHQLISSILSVAVEWQVIYSNPCQRVRAPKVPVMEAHYLEEEDAKRLLKLLEEESIEHRAMIYLLMFTGMRRGEMCGLEWADLDMKKGTIKIKRNSLYIPERGVYTDTPKTGSSVREIRVPDVVMNLLKEHRRNQLEERILLGDRWHDCDRIFTTWEGKPIFPDTPTRWFRDFVKKHDLPPITLHSLRHTSATLLIAGGTDIRTVSRRLGHSRASTTLNIYSHALRSADEVACETLETMLKVPESV